MSEASKPLTVPREFLGPPGAWNPTLLMFVAAVILAVGSTVGYWCWGLPGWCCFVFNTIALHLVGTVIHDASHNVAHGDRIMNAVLGHGSALMLGFSVPVFTRVHMQHHANVNDPDNDPDHVVSTMGPLWLIAPRFFYHEIYFFQRRLWRKYELLEWFIARAIFFSVVLASIHYGFFKYLCNFWFSPALVVGMLLGLFFDYLPHRPFDERDRWKNARVYPGRILNLLIGGQNYHLVHHLWPSIPWYKYEAAYWATKPLLDQKGCRQTLGILQDKKNFWNFVYDVLIGIRFHKHEKSIAVDGSAIERLEEAMQQKDAATHPVESVAVLESTGRKAA
jgi:beta-carotene hydroxylase